VEFDKENNVSERLAGAMYKQGELAEKNNDRVRAVQLYMKAVESSPDSAVAPIAQFDAASLLIKQQSLEKATALLEAFKQQYPGHKLQSQVSKKLAVLYLQGDNSEKSAVEFERIAQAGEFQPEERRDALWQAAELYQSTDNEAKVQQLLSLYVKEYPLPLAQAMEARLKLVELYGNAGDTKSQNYWRLSLIDAEKTAGKNTTARAQYLAATAALQLAVALQSIFNDIPLVPPLKESLRKKKQAMRAAIDGLEKVNGYAIEETSTQATFLTAEIYRDFSQALLHSPRPDGLEGLALEQYGLLLEEQAFPFEEKAIEFYKSNTTLVKTGTFNEWISRSYERLARLLPTRYGKQEKLDAFIEPSARLTASTTDVD